MSKAKRTLAVLLSACLATGLFYGCGGEGATQPAAANSPAAGGSAEDGELPPLKIGMVTQLTGPNAFGGHEYQYGAEMALEHIGGEINGRKIEMVFADGPTQDATLSEFERLYNDGVRVFISGYGCIADRTFATMADDMQALYLSLAWDADLLQGPSTYFFRGGANVDDFSRGAMMQAIDIGKTFLGKDAKDLKVALLYTTRLQHVANPMLETAEANGVQVVINEGYPDTNKDFMPIITKLQNTDYDILIPIQGTPDGTLFLKKIHELNYRPKVILAGGIFYDTPNFSDLGNEITNGILTQSYTNPSISEDAAPGITKFKEDFEAEYGHKPLAHALQAYGGMNVYFECLKKVDPKDWDDTAKLAAAMKSLDFEEGKLPWYWGIKWDEFNSNTRAGQMVISEWMDGDMYAVYPDFLRTKDPVIPWEQ